MMQKWNEKLQRYFPYDPPVKDGIYPLICYDMDTVINCASCGDKITYGSGYCSQIIHNSKGLGYTVCPDCHHKELIDRLNNRRIYE